MTIKMNGSDDLKVELCSTDHLSKVKVKQLVLCMMEPEAWVYEGKKQPSSYWHECPHCTSKNARKTCCS